MLSTIESLRGFTFAAVTLRLTLAMLCGGMLGLDRAKKHRPAGFRTYMIVCLAATLTMLLGQYEHIMLTGPWAAQAAAMGLKTDVSRFGAQVINGIGFLGAGTILVTGHQEVKGLTTAAGLWAAACTGLAIGAGFYEGVIIAFIVLFLSISVLRPLENHIMDHARNMNLYVEFNSMDDLGSIIGRIKAEEVHIYEVDISRGEARYGQKPSAVFYLRLQRHQKHELFLMHISELSCISRIDQV